MGVSLRGQGQTRRLALFGTKGVVSRCRDFTREALEDWGWIPAGAAAEVEPEVGEAELVEDVLLLVSEVVTNACLHAGGPTELVLIHDGERLRIEVADASPESPRRRPPQDASQPGGHGLIVLERLARSWGWAPRGDGKVVWLEVGSPSGAERARPTRNR
ncbi:ATP-binding protein [Streptomyces sp. NBC_01210]|uniref:ATP-binding protein n=1 Tax=Streptomyces sp. NBC_01210 TaxID=2903774 RepID=UPI002E136C02|nr:ATP-binding protein [Streptomyces sp. NBC_01210]